jgi:hypothetical protein
MASQDDDEAFAKKVNARFQSFRKGETTSAGKARVPEAARFHPFTAGASHRRMLFFLVGTNHPLFFSKLF